MVFAIAGNQLNSRWTYLKASKDCENWKLFCAMPLHVAEAEPLLGQPPLSRPNDQKDKRVRKEFDPAKFRTVLVSGSLNISVLVSLMPIITVKPMLELSPADTTWL